MAVSISPNATVDPQAELGVDVVIGAYCVVGPRAKIGDGTRLECHATILGDVTLGCQNRIYPNVVLGGDPQDLGYRGSPTRLRIGDHNIIRENVTVNCGSEKENRVTMIGNHCYLMANSHVAHDCHIGNQVVIANSTQLGGHVHVHDHATISGLVGVHHFATIGRYSFVSGLSRIQKDVPPFMLCEGSPARPRCVNVVALKRNSFADEIIKSLAEAHRLIFRSRVGVDQARELLRRDNRLVPQVTELLDFLEHLDDGQHGRTRDIRRAA